MPTRRLYYDDPYLRDFACQVLRCESVMRNSHSAPLYEVVTDATAFYPNSGGQPSDRGTLAGADVVDVIERGKEIVHITSTAIGQGPASGRIDIERRFDHIQQHSGQHILSGAFASLFGLETVSFHLGDEYVTIDLNAPDISRDQLAAAERLACEVVFQNRPIRSTFWDRDAADSAIDPSRLRKLPTRTENIRLIDIDGFDLTPCGGTHARATGEVGMIKITRAERIRGITRVEFVCGRRALADYRWKNRTVHETAAMLSVHGRDLPESVGRLQTQVRDTGRRLEQAQKELHQYQAAAMYDEAQPAGQSGIRVVSWASNDGHDLGYLKMLAHKICEHPRAVALLGSSNGESAHVVFEKSHDVSIDVSKILREVLPEVEGKGGGTRQIAQGGGRRPDKLPRAISMAAAIVSKAVESNDQDAHAAASAATAAAAMAASADRH